MSTLQVRNVPEELSRELKVRAAAAGTSLSGYVLDQLQQMVLRPSAEEVLQRIRERDRFEVSDPVEELAQGRTR